MEKIVYVIWAGEGADLLGSVGALAAAGSSGVQVNLADGDVAAAGQWRIENNAPAPDAFVSLWLPTAYGPVREPVDEVVRSASGAGARVGAYLVTESVPLSNTRFPVAVGERTPGFAQVALLRKPASQSQEEFLRCWLDDHTGVAIDTQSTFVYVQNLVVRTLIPEGEPCDAIVEECFPAEAMDDLHAFFDAVGDDERLADHTGRMLASTARFLDMDRLDVIPTSRYVFGTGG